MVISLNITMITETMLIEYEILADGIKRLNNVSYSCFLSLELRFYVIHVYGD